MFVVIAVGAVVGGAVGGLVWCLWAIYLSMLP